MADIDSFEDDMDTECCVVKTQVTDSCVTGGEENMALVSARKELALVEEGQGSETGAGGRKRGRENENEEVERGDTVEKRGCEEGMSWWTCLMLGMDQENTKPQVVRKIHTQHN